MRLLPHAITAALTLALSLPLVSTAVAAPNNKKGEQNPDWPCVQRKVETLSAAQMWDGPKLIKPESWWNDEKLSKLIPVLISRRLNMEQIEKALDDHLAAIPEAERDTYLSGLFAILLEKSNTSRRSIMSGIERFQRRQTARARKLEEQGRQIAALEAKAQSDATANEKVTELQKLYDWNVRIFRERQENIPIACEIPVLIEQRAFALARAIRARMTQ